MNRPPRRSAFPRVAVASLALAFPTAAQVTTRISVSSSGAEASQGSSAGSVSADGRFVLFSSASPDLVPGDTNAQFDAFVRDTVLGTTERVSIGSTGNEALGFNTGIALSADGRFVLFESTAPGLVPEDTNAHSDGFVRDRVLGTTALVTLDAAGASIPAAVSLPRMSTDGRFVLFASGWVNVVPGDTNGVSDVFVRDRQLGTTERVSLGAGGVEANQNCTGLAVTVDGRFVLFSSAAPNLVPGDTNGAVDLFVRDRQLGVTERVNVSTAGAQANVVGLDLELTGTLSDDGRVVAFASSASNLVPGDTNGFADVFARDRALGTTTRISVSAAGVQGPGPSSTPFVTPNGRYVLFTGFSSNLVPGDTNAAGDVFLRDLQLGTIEIVSRRTDGTQPNGTSQVSGTSYSPDVRFVAFQSQGSNVVPADTNGAPDAFLRDRRPAIASFCANDGLGTDHTSACPCGNIGAPGRGCGHSFDPNGALLDATGFPENDDVTLRSHGTPSTSFTLFLQHASGGDAVFHDGVLCASGALVRLRGRAASGGGAAFPDTAFANDATTTLSQRGGGLWHSGLTRFYSAWYRNASTTFCPPATANVTNGLVIAW